jgi:hypothetical protein
MIQKRDTYNRLKKIQMPVILIVIAKSYDAKYTPKVGMVIAYDRIYTIHFSFPKSP